jgi:hypothetical protein
MPIYTQRLIIRPHQVGDGDMLAIGVADTWDELYQWFHLYMAAKEQETNPRLYAGCRA